MLVHLAHHKDPSSRQRQDHHVVVEEGKQIEKAAALEMMSLVSASKRTRTAGNGSALPSDEAAASLVAETGCIRPQADQSGRRWPGIHVTKAGDAPRGATRAPAGSSDCPRGDDVDGRGERVRGMAAGMRATRTAEMAASPQGACRALRGPRGSGEPTRSQTRKRAGAGRRSSSHGRFRAKGPKRSPRVRRGWRSG